MIRYVLCMYLLKIENKNLLYSRCKIIRIFEIFDELWILINQLITCINKSVPVPRSGIRSMIRKYSVGITVIFHRKDSFSMTETCFENIFFTSQSRELKKKYSFELTRFFVKMWRKKVHIKLAQQSLRGCNKRLTNLTTSCQSMKKSGNQNFLTTA